MSGPLQCWFYMATSFGILIMQSAAIHVTWVGDSRTATVTTTVAGHQQLEWSCWCHYSLELQHCCPQSHTKPRSFVAMAFPRNTQLNPSSISIPYRPCLVRTHMCQYLKSLKCGEMKPTLNARGRAWQCQMVTFRRSAEPSNNPALRLVEVGIPIMGTVMTQPPGSCI